MNIKRNAVIKYRDQHIEEAHAAKAAGVSFIPKQDYCAICTSMDKQCPREFPGCINWGDSEEEEKEKLEDSDWDEDIEEKDNEARALLRRPKYPPNVLIFQNRKPPAGWANGVKRKAAAVERKAEPKPESKPEPEQDYEEINSKSMEELE